MDHLDSQTVRKIWQRVQGSSNPPAPEHHPQCTLAEQISRELSTAQLYQRLARSMPKHRRLLMQLAGQEGSHAQILKGICVASEGHAPKDSFIPIEKAPFSALLQRCYHQKLQLISEYENRCNDPRYGNVFRKLLQQEQQQCRILLQLMGSIPSSPKK